MERFVAPGVEAVGSSVAAAVEAVGRYVGVAGTAALGVVDFGKAVGGGAEGAADGREVGGRALAAALTAC